MHVTNKINKFKTYSNVVCSLFAYKYDEYLVLKFLRLLVRQYP